MLPKNNKPPFAASDNSGTPSVEPPPLWQPQTPATPALNTQSNSQYMRSGFTLTAQNTPFSTSQAQSSHATPFIHPNPSPFPPATPSTSHSHGSYSLPTPPPTTGRRRTQPLPPYTPSGFTSLPQTPCSVALPSQPVLNFD